MFNHNGGNRHGAISGFKVGIVVLKTNHLLLEGNVQNALSFDFPVLYEVVDVPFSALMAGDSQVDNPLEQAILRLQESGVSVIVGACGSFANWQWRVRAFAKIPVYLSIMAQVPFVLAGLPLKQKLGVVFANADAYSLRVCRECSIGNEDQSRLVIFGANEVPEFESFFTNGGEKESSVLEKRLVELLQLKKQQNPEIGAWLFQCSDLPPYAAAVQTATGLAVYDMVLLINHVYQVVTRHRYS